MQLDKYEKQHKAYIKAEKRLNQIYKEIRNLPYRQLKDPYQEGWRLVITLRDDYLRSKRGPVVLGLINRFKEDWVIKNPKLISQIRKKPALMDVRSILSSKYKYMSFVPRIREITKREYNTLSTQQKKYFTQNSEYIAFDWKKDHYFFNIPSHYLVVKIEKRIITHIQDINPILEKEKDQLHKFLEPYYRTGYRGWDKYFENRKERRKSKVEMSKYTQLIEHE